MFPTGDNILVKLMPQKVSVTKLSQEGPYRQLFFWSDSTVLGAWLWNQEGTLVTPAWQDLASIMATHCPAQKTWT